MAALGHKRTSAGFIRRRTRAEVAATGNRALAWRYRVGTRLLSIPTIACRVTYPTDHTACYFKDRARGELTMKLKVFGFCVVLASLLSTRAIAEPLVTISCDKPEGFNIVYGVSLTERFNASQNNQQRPTEPSLKGPTKDGYSGKPTFVIDSNKKNMTIGWTKLPEDVELKKQAKEAGLPQLPPVPAADGVVVQFSKEHISAVQVDPWSIMTFSFFPTLGTAFISQQIIQLASKNTVQLASFAHCEFLWATPQ
jgi:hypothetical protein